MPTFYMENEEGYVRNDLDLYVQITIGDDPIVICCDEATADRLIDARTVLGAVQMAYPKKFEYDASMTLFLTRLVELWPLNRPPSWQQLTDIFNHCKFMSPQNMVWTRHSLMQKMKSLGWEIASIVNPNGSEDVRSPYAMQQPAQADKLPDAMERFVGTVTYVLPTNPENEPAPRADSDLFKVDDPF